MMDIQKAQQKPMNGRPLRCGDWGFPNFHKEADISLCMMAEPAALRRLSYCTAAREMSVVKTFNRYQIWIKANSLNFWRAFNALWIEERLQKLVLVVSLARLCFRCSQDVSRHIIQ